MSGSITTTATPAEELELTSPPDWGSRCVLCERIWPDSEDAIHHEFVTSNVEPKMVCETCGGTGKEPTWHTFQNRFAGGPIFGQGVVCPECVTTKGIGAATNAAAEAALKVILIEWIDQLAPPVPEA